MSQKNMQGGFRDWKQHLLSNLSRASAFLRAYPAEESISCRCLHWQKNICLRRNSSPWAEFLDTNKPEEEQEWKASKDPIFLQSCSREGCTQLFTFPYDLKIFLIGCGLLPNKDDVLYNVVDGCSSRYKCFPKISPWNFAYPFTVISDKTIYWIEDSFLMAYELEKHVHYHVDMADILFPYAFVLSATCEPLLVHLEDNIYNMFSFFKLFCFGPAQTDIVGCTNVRVRKGYPGSKTTILEYPGSKTTN